MASQTSASLILLSFLLFVGGTLAGYLSAGELSASLTGILSEELSPILKLPKPLLALAVFANNFSKTFTAMLLGLLLAIPPILFILANGFILGVVSFEVAESEGTLFLLLGILPHGVFEVSAAALSTALGIRLGAAAYARLKGRSFEVGRTLKLCLKFYFSRIVPLLAVAAVVEVYVTPTLLSLL